METFWQWLSRLDENYFSFDPKEYNELFHKELEKVIARTSSPAHVKALEGMQHFNWTGYIAASVRHSGCRDQREVQERTHDIATKLLMGKLFRGFDQQTSGPFDRRFKQSVSNAIRNMAELERNRKHNLPTVPIQQQFTPGAVTADDLPAKSWTGSDPDSERVVRGFWRLVRRRLGDLGVAILNARLNGLETKSLVGSPALVPLAVGASRMPSGSLKNLGRSTQPP